MDRLPEYLAFWNGSGAYRNSPMGESAGKDGDQALGLGPRTLYTRYAVRDAEFSSRRPYLQAVNAILNPGDSVLVESPVYA